MNETPKLLWQPAAEFKRESNLNAYLDWLRKTKKSNFQDYDSLWEWSVTKTDEFWQSIYDYFGVISHSPYEQVLSDDPMPDAKWFEGATVNYAEHIFRKSSSTHAAIIFQSESGESKEVSWEELKEQVTALASYLKSLGVEKGDCIAAFLPNIPEATIAFLATCSIGAVWSCCSPDFGANSVIDRFHQIKPVVFITVDGYTYGGKTHSKREVVNEILPGLLTVKQVIQIPYIDGEAFIEGAAVWDQAISSTHDAELEFTPVPFDHPIWVLFSSGTTGQPKAITHSHGGVLLEHLKYIHFHNDVKPGERYFWYTTTGWMMWNFVQATLLAGATIVLYDGSPAFPHLNVLWRLAAEHRINHFGTSAPFIIACMKAGLTPGKNFDMSSLRSVSSTGSPLPPEGFDWVYKELKPNVWLCSMSGGTDVCSAFVGGCPLEPVYEGEIQRRALGCAMYAFDDEGNSIKNEVGEMVVIRPMPSMPVFFWNDKDNIRYKESYFEMFPGIWRHGDWLLITERNTLVIKGRSDATLNRHGIRIGTAEIYQSVNKIPEVKDSLVVNLELNGGGHFMPLFIVMNEGYELNKDIQRAISNQLRRDFTSRHIPDDFVAVSDLPYTISGKKMEAPVKKILMGKPLEKAANLGAMRNPESLDFFLTYAKTIK